MTQHSRGALCIKITILAAVFATIALGTWNADVQQYTVSMFVAGLIVAMALIAMFLVWVFTVEEKSALPSKS